MYPALFEPFQLKSLRLRNRIAMAPMTRSFSPGGVPGLNVADYYRRRAEGGAGLILSEGTVVDRPASGNDPAVPRFYGKDALNGWNAVIGAVHGAGGAMAPQLWHAGVIAPHASGWLPDAPFEGPSGLETPDKTGGIAMEKDSIEKTVKAFASAAGSAQELGFDAIEIHAAHGYLIDQFFWSMLNRRGDVYGGAMIDSRSRFAVEIVKAIREAVGDDFPVIMRISQFKQQDYTAKIAEHPKELELWLQPLAEAGVDMFHCSQRRVCEPEFPNSDLNLAGWVKRVTGQPTIAVGSVGLSNDLLSSFAGECSSSTPIEEAVERLARGDFDILAVGRAFLANPEWPNLMKKGAFDEILPFSSSMLSELY